MIRVTELFRGDASYEIVHSSALLARGLGEGFQVDQRVIEAGGGLRQTAKAIRALRRARPDVVHAYGLQALVAAALSGAGRIIYSPPCNMCRGDARTLRAIAAYRPFHVACATEGRRRKLIANGVTPLCDVIRPGIDPTTIRKAEESTDLRRRLGLKDEDFVILLAEEATFDAHQRDAIWAVGILHVLDSRYKALIWGNGKGAASLERFGGRIGTPDLLRSGARHGGGFSFETLLPVADLVLASAAGCTESLPLATAMAAGKPIVAVAGQTNGELLEGGRSALLTPTSSPRLLARRIQEARSDSSLSRLLADGARARADELFSMDRHIDQWRRLLETPEG